MSYLDRLPQVSSGVHDHELPTPDQAFCSCCRKSIISGLHNVIRITKTPETVLDFNGEKLGTQGEEHVKAWYHAKCFQDFHIPSKKIIECNYCGVFSMAPVLRDGKPNSCLCNCHKKGAFCSMILTSI